MEDVIVRLEKIRQEALKKSLIGWAVVGIIWVILLLCLGMPVGLFSGIAVLIAVEVLYLGKVKNKFVYGYKRELLQGQLEAVFENVSLSPDSGFSEEEIEGWCLIATSDRFDSDDLIEADYHGCHLRRSDILIQDVRKSGKTTTVVTIFQGPYMIFEFPKRFSKYTVVKEKEFLSNGRPGGWLFGNNNIERVEFESEQFNETFVVYTSDGTEAFYLLTPSLMEKLMEINRRQEGRFYFGFIDNELHIAIDNRENAFEPSLFQEVNGYEVKRIQRQIEPIMELVDLLQLGKGE